MTKKAQIMNHVTIDLPNLVDLALGHPEVGAVNFNIMQCVMQVILKLSGLQGTELEFRGDDANRLKYLEKIHPVQSQYILSDYKISEKGSEDQTAKHKIVVQPTKKLDELEEKVNKINDTLFQLLKIPTDETIINSVKSMATGSIGSERVTDETGLIPTPTNIWHLLTIEKRVEAAEQGIDKLTSLIETLALQNIGGSGTLSDKVSSQFASKGSKKILKDIQTTSQFDTNSYTEMLDNFTKNLNALTERVVHLESRYVEVVGYEPSNDLTVGSGSVLTESLRTPNSEIESQYKNKDFKDSEGYSDDEEEELKNVPLLTRNSGISLKATEKTKERSITEIGLEELIGRKGSLMNALNEIDELKKSFKNFKQKTSDFIKQEEENRQEKGDFEVIYEKIEPYFEKFREQMTYLDNMFHQQIEEVHHQIANIEEEMGVLVEKVNSGGVDNGDPGDAGGFTDVYNKLARIQNELTQITSLTSNLQEDKEEKEAKIEALMESIEFLKSIKADKDEIEDALANKADQQYVNRKVSHDQFDAACDDLSRNLEDALLKLTQQEEFWNETLEALQSEIESKLDKAAIQPLHDFVTGKLKTLHQRLKALSDLRREAEAAGTKARLLKDVNCLSCDKPAIMYRDAKIPSIPEETPLPPSKSMKPYLTYELDKARKQQRKGQIHRNINNIEIIKEHQQLPDNRDIDEKTDDTYHLCNRYCGGTHTVRAPYQRITHTSHYLQPQMALQAVPLKEGYTRGNDGKMYRVRNDQLQTSAKSYSTAQSRVGDSKFGDEREDDDGFGIKSLYKPCTCKEASPIPVTKKQPMKGPVKRT